MPNMGTCFNAAVCQLAESCSFLQHVDCLNTEHCPGLIIFRFDYFLRVISRDIRCGGGNNPKYWRNDKGGEECDGLLVLGIVYWSSFSFHAVPLLFYFLRFKT